MITILEDSGEIKYIKSSVAHPDQHTPKVIVGGVPKPIVLFDKEGEYGLFARGQRHYFVGEDLDTSALTTFCSGTDGFVTTWTVLSFSVVIA